MAILALAYPSVISPMLMQIFPSPTNSFSSIEETLRTLMAPRLENKIFWPLLLSIAALLIARNWSRLTFPPQVICLLAYLGFAGASSLWAFKPDLSMQRFILQAMILTCVVIPTMLAARTADTTRGLFLCFGAACILNIPFVATQNPIYLEGIDVGYAGYFTFKGTLGQCAAIAFLLALHEMLYPGRRRVMGIIVIAVATALLFLSKSKGSLALAIIAPILAGMALHASKRLHVSLIIILLPIPISYWIFTKLVGNFISRISWHIYGNYSLSGRTYIWDFANSQIAQKPLFGWGYQSFWLVGSDAPSVVNAWGWIKTLPNAHSGYMDTMLEMGYIGFSLLIAFLLATLHSIGRISPSDPRRAWFLLTLSLFVILVNILESIWMRGMDMLWLMFAFVAAETARYWVPAHNRSSQPAPGRLGRMPPRRAPSYGARRLPRGLRAAARR